MFASFVAKETAAAATDVNPWDPDFIRPTRVFDVMEEKPHKALRDFYDVGVDEAYKTSTIRIRRCNLISKHVTSLMQRATTRCPHLEVLELTSNFSLRGDNLGINDHGHEAYTRNGDGIDAIIDVVRTSRTLRKLGLRKNALDASAVANLAHALRANRHTVLHTLELGQNPWVHYHGCLTIAHMMVTNRSITSLDMSYCDVGNSAPEFASALLKNRAVATLSLRGNSIDSHGAIALADALLSATRSSLTHLDLSYNGIEHEGADALARMLRYRRCRLRVLDLSCNALSNGGTEMAGLRALTAALERNRSLRELGLRNTGMVGLGARKSAYVRADLLAACMGPGDALAESLLHNRTVCKLDISANGIRAGRAQRPILQAISKCPTAVSDAGIVKRCVHGRLEQAAERLPGFPAAFLAHTKKIVLAYSFAMLQEKRDVRF